MESDKFYKAFVQRCEAYQAQQSPTQGEQGEPFSRPPSNTGNAGDASPPRSTTPPLAAARGKSSDAEETSARIEFGLQLMRAEELLLAEDVTAPSTPLETVAARFPIPKAPPATADLETTAATTLIADEINEAAPLCAADAQPADLVSQAARFATMHPSPSHLVAQLFKTFAEEGYSPAASAGEDRDAWPQCTVKRISPATVVALRVAGPITRHTLQSLRVVLVPVHEPSEEDAAKKLEAARSALSSWTPQGTHGLHGRARLEQMDANYYFSLSLPLKTGTLDGINDTGRKGVGDNVDQDGKDSDNEAWATLQGLAAAELSCVVGRPVSRASLRVEALGLYDQRGIQFGRPAADAPSNAYEHGAVAAFLSAKSLLALASEGGSEHHTVFICSSDVVGEDMKEAASFVAETLDTRLADCATATVSCMADGTAAALANMFFEGLQDGQEGTWLEEVYHCLDWRRARAQAPPCLIVGSLFSRSTGVEMTSSKVSLGGQTMIKGADIARVAGHLKVGTSTHVRGAAWDVWLTLNNRITVRSTLSFPSQLWTRTTLKGARNSRESNYLLSPLYQCAQRLGKCRPVTQKLVFRLQREKLVIGWLHR